MSLGWRFRGGNPDGGRDYGNANVWAFDPTLDVFTREVCQNTLDAKVGHSVDLDFSLFRLVASDLAAFLPAIDWSGLEPHLRASADTEQKFGRELKQGLDHLDEREEMVVLRITETQASGLLGAERGDKSNFAALCRNNLDSEKGGTAGGAFGLGKAVLWRCSSLSTVLFHSDLVRAVDHDEDRRRGRLFGRCELAWHQLGGDEFAGPGWFGEADEKGQSISAWNAQAAAAAMLLDRPEGTTGTSILVIGFHDPSREGQETVDDMAAHLARALCVHFWPAIHSGNLCPSVGYWGDGVSGARTDVPVDLSRFVGPFIDLADKARDGETGQELTDVGAVAHRAVTLGIPPRHDGHAALEHHPDLYVRRADAATEQELANRVALTRGRGMVVDYWHLPNLRVGARPFHALLRCGEASSDHETAEAAEMFLRVAEPPSHDEWKVTPDMGADYKQGGGARLNEMRDEIRDALRRLVAPATGDAGDGPEALKRLLTIKVPAERKGEPRVTKLGGEVVGNTWEMRVTITAQPRPGHTWQFRLAPRTAVEGGPKGKVRVKEIFDLHRCSLGDGHVRMEPGKRQCALSLRLDPESLPGEPEDLAVEVALADRETVEVP